MLPARAPHPCHRQPLRVLAGSSLRSPDGAPQTGSASALTSPGERRNHRPEQIRARLRQLLRDLRRPIAVALFAAFVVGGILAKVVPLWLVAVLGLAVGAAVFVFVDRYPRLPRSR